MSEKFLSSQQREIARLRCTTWQAFNFLMVAWLLSANHVSQSTQPPAENGICLCQTEVSSLRPRIGNAQKLSPATHKERGVHIFGARGSTPPHTLLAFNIACCYICAEPPPLRKPQTTLGKRSANFYSSLLRFRFFGDHSLLLYSTRHVGSIL
jgi:hypothetical protein